MEDDSMVGTLRCQAALIWPLEREVLRRRVGERLGRVLDIGCGTGEILRRVGSEFDTELLVGLDLFAGHLQRADGSRLRADAFRPPFPDATFDLVLVRHLLQALPRPVALLREARRLLRPGGRIHLLVEDYQAILFDSDDFAVANHFTHVAPAFHARGTDLYQGRKALRHLHEAGFTEIAVDPVLIDNQSCDRDMLAGVFRFWKAGYATKLSELLGVPLAESERRFDAMVEAALDPGRYVAWLLFALSGRYTAAP